MEDRQDSSVSEIKETDFERREVEIVDGKVIIDYDLDEKGFIFLSRAKDSTNAIYFINGKYPYTGVEPHSKVIIDLYDMLSPVFNKGLK